MRKTDKKIDSQLINLLTDVCDSAAEGVEGFQWLTHRVNYSNFPESLQIICVFDTDESVTRYKLMENKVLLPLIQAKLNTMGIKFKNIAPHVSYDSEERCNKEHGGNWAKRLDRH